MLGVPTVHTPVPWFWTHQYGTNIQAAGNPQGPGTLTVEGDLEALDFTALLHHEDRLTGVVCAGRAREFKALRTRLDTT
ncbi:hypothetical protein GCM10020254_76920 [Streptomyces goshikiensis]